MSAFRDGALARPFDDSLVRVLNRGRWGNPDVLLVRARDGLAVVKDFAPRSAFVRATLGRWNTRREVAAYERLSGLPCVPALLGRVDALAFAVEFREGERLSRALVEDLPPDFHAQLRDAVAAMHARAVVHLDLRHRGNVLMDRSGRPVLLDFASAICFRRESWLDRWLRPGLARVDARAVAKWADRLRPGAAASRKGPIRRWRRRWREAARARRRAALRSDREG